MSRINAIYQRPARCPGGVRLYAVGAIVESKGNVTGTATAASIWNTGLIGIAVAFSRYEIAIVMALINLVMLRYVNRLEVDD